MEAGDQEAEGVLMRIASFVREYIQYAIMASVMAGTALATLGGGIQTPRPVLLGVIVVGVVFPLMINMRFEAVIAHLRSPRPLFCSLFLNFVVSPAVALLVTAVFLPDQPEMRLAILLLALLPTSAMSAAWTALSGARLETALFLIPANLLFAAFVALPFGLPLIAGSDVSIETTHILTSIGIVFVLPLVAGDLLRRVLVRRIGQQRFARRVKPRLGTVSANAVVLLVFLVMAQPRNAALVSRWTEVLWLLVPVASFYMALYLTSTAFVWGLIRRRALPADQAVVIAYTTVTRHINITLAIALSALPPEAASSAVLVVVLAYVVQLPSMAFYAQRVGRRIVESGAAPVMEPSTVGSGVDGR